MFGAETRPALTELRTNVVSAKALRPKGPGFATAGAAASARSAAYWAIKVPTFHEMTSNTCIHTQCILGEPDVRPGCICLPQAPLPARVGRIRHPLTGVDGKR